MGWRRGECRKVKTKIGPYKSSIRASPGIIIMIQVQINLVPICFLKDQEQSMRLLFPIDGPEVDPDDVLMPEPTKKQNSTQSTFYARKKKQKKNKPKALQPNK